MLKVLNSTNSPKTLNSFDGDSVVIPARCPSMVDEKFDWNLPKGVKILKRIEDKQIHGPVENPQDNNL